MTNIPMEQLPYLPYHTWQAALSGEVPLQAPRQTSPPKSEEAAPCTSLSILACWGLSASHGNKGQGGGVSPAHQCTQR